MVAVPHYKENYNKYQEIGGSASNKGIISLFSKKFACKKAHIGFFLQITDFGHMFLYKHYFNDILLIKMEDIVALKDAVLFDTKLRLCRILGANG